MLLLDFQCAYRIHTPQHQCMGLPMLSTLHYMGCSHPQNLLLTPLVLN
jgi:hypothetical protein